jgi:hypothetical protein
MVLISFFHPPQAFDHTPRAARSPTHIYFHNANNESLFSPPAPPTGASVLVETAKRLYPVSGAHGTTGASSRLKFNYIPNDTSAATAWPVNGGESQAHPQE